MCGISGRTSCTDSHLDGPVCIHPRAGPVRRLFVAALYARHSSPEQGPDQDSPLSLPGKEALGVDFQSCPGAKVMIFGHFQLCGDSYPPCGFANFTTSGNFAVG